jgi:hypothetical protein
MPGWLRKQLEQGGKKEQRNIIGPDGQVKTHCYVPNETENLVPAIRSLLQQDNEVERAFLCHPAVTHFAKSRLEGSFCGYRNSQMMISYITNSKAPGYDKFEDGVPTILQLQDIIEDAWDRGINPEGRLETGGIKGTRKYIGTSEVSPLPN